MRLWSWDTDVFIGEMKESHSRRFDVIWVQGSSFVSSCTWCGVFAVTLVFSRETSFRIDGNSEVHPRGWHHENDHCQFVGPGRNARCQPFPQVIQFWQHISLPCAVRFRQMVQHKIRNLKAALGGVIGVEGFQGQRRS